MSADVVILIFRTLASRNTCEIRIIASKYATE
jgi:hypothetical protein